MTLDPKYRRKRASEVVAGGNQAMDISYNRQAGAMKSLTVNGMLTPIGNCATRLGVDTGATIAFFNDGAATVFVRFGDNAVTAPTGGADGLCVPSKQYVVFSAGASTSVIASGACFAYIVEDDTFLSL